MLAGRSIHELNRDYLDALALARELGLAEEQLARLEAYRRFIERQAHLLGPHPAALYPLAVAQPLDSPVRAQALERLAQGHGPVQPWFRLLNPPATDPNAALRRTFVGHTGAVTCVALLHDRRRALSCSNDRTLRLWDLETGQELRRFEGHTDWVRSVAVLHDGRRALSCGDDRTLRLWDLESGRCLALFPCDYAIYCVASTPQRPWIACAGDEHGNVLFFRIEE